MDSAEANRQQQSGRPKPDSLCKRELRVTAREEFFKQSYDNEHHRPKSCKLQNPDTVQRDSAEIKCARRPQQEQKTCDCQQAPSRSTPEVQAESSPAR